MTLESEIRECFARMGVELADQGRGLLKGSKWQANSQYGYSMAEFDTKEEAEYYVILYYSSNMKLIRQ